MSSEQADRPATVVPPPAPVSVPAPVPALASSNLRYLIWWQRLLRDGLPEPGDGWTATRIQSGLRLSRNPEDRAAGATAELVVADPERLTLVVEAERPDDEVVAVVESALALLAPQGPRGVRLVLPLVDAALGQGLAERHDLDLVAPAGRVLVTPNGLAVATGFHPGHPTTFWQWHRYRPGRPSEPCGALHPCPPWEQALVRRRVGTGKIPGMPDIHVRRVAGGLVLHGADEHADEVAAFVRVAGLVRPDPERLTVVVRSNDRDEAMRAALGELLGALHRAAPLRLRLLWPQAAAARQGAGLQALADRYGAEITAPDSEVHPEGPACLRSAEGAGGADGCWYRFTPFAEPQPLGPTLTLSPAPVTSPSPAQTPVLTPAPTPVPAPAVTPARTPLPAQALGPASVPVGAPAQVGGPPVLGAARGLPVSGLLPALAVAQAAGPVPGGPATAASPMFPVQQQAPTNPQPAAPEPPAATPAPPNPETPTPATPTPANPTPAMPTPANPTPVTPTPVTPAPVTPVPATATPAMAASVTPVLGTAAPVTPASVTPVPATAAPATAAPATATPAAPIPAAPTPATEAPAVTASEAVATATAAPGAAVPAAAAPEAPARALLLVERDHDSTPEERQRYREQAGARHEKHVIAVARILAQRPALRGASSHEAEDLAALRAYLCGEPADLDAVLRGADPEPVRAQTACLVSGLRVLPAFRGAVFRRARLSQPALDEYRPGRELVEPGFVCAVPLPAEAEDPGAPDGSAGPVTVLFAVWSQSARRTAWLDTGRGVEELVFATGTRFTVLAVDRPAEADAAVVVHLRERGRDDGADARILERLRAAVSVVPEAAPTGRGRPVRAKQADQRPALLPRHGFPIGLDVRQHPYPSVTVPPA